MFNMRDEVIDDWYDGLNDLYEHDMRYDMIAMYLEAIIAEDTDHDY